MILTVVDVVLYVTYFLLLFFSIFWLQVLFFSEEREPRKKRLQKLPFFSVIVPAYNEEKNISQTLLSLINLDYPRNKSEIIVVNDGSTDQTLKVVEQFLQEHSQVKIQLFNQKNLGKGRAMNHGLEKAKGEFFACLDADSFISPGAIKKILPYFEADPKVAAVCPLLKVKKPKSVLEKVQWYEYIVNMFYRYLNAKLNCIHVTPGPFSVYRTKVVRELGGYDEKNITEDLEIAIRLQKYHYKIIQTFETIAETVAPLNWKTLFKQRVRWYKGALDNFWHYRNLSFNREYGDFGYLRMPTIVLSGFITILLFFTLSHEAMTKFWRWLSALRSVHFDLITLIKNFHFDFNLLNLPFAKIFIALTLFGFSFFMMIYAYKVIQEKLTRHGRTFLSLLTYLFIYGFFLTLVWVYIAFLTVTKKKIGWA